KRSTLDLHHGRLQIRTSRRGSRRNRCRMLLRERVSSNARDRTGDQGRRRPQHLSAIHSTCGLFRYFVGHAASWSVEDSVVSVLSVMNAWTSMTRGAASVVGIVVLVAIGHLGRGRPVLV